MKDKLKQKLSKERTKQLDSILSQLEHIVWELHAIVPYFIVKKKKESHVKEFLNYLDMSILSLELQLKEEDGL